MNAFQQIEANDKLPEHVKEEMLSSLDIFKLIADVVDLFFVKSGQSLSKALDANSSSEMTTPSTKTKE